MVGNDRIGTGNLGIETCNIGWSEVPATHSRWVLSGQGQGRTNYLEAVRSGYVSAQHKNCALAKFSNPSTKI